MEVTTTAKYVRMSPKKLGLVAKMVCGLKAAEAIERLNFTGKRAAKPLIKAINTCLADAVNTFKLKKDTLVVKTIDIGEGPKFKRWRPVARGIAHPYAKRTSHIKVVLEDKEEKKSETQKND